MGYSNYYYCRECIKMDLEDKNKYDPEKSYCTEYHCYYNPNSHACDNHFEPKIQNTNTSSCYLTTIICEILKNDDNCEILKTMRSFRDNYLQTNPEFYPILYEYDQIGPILSEKLKHDNFKNIISFMMQELYLKPIVLDIENKEYNKAIIAYKKMVLELKRFYKIDNIQIIEENKTKVKQLGHGYFVK